MLIFCLSSYELLRQFALVPPVSNPAAPFGIANNYGLFAVMTTSRLEISVEGSNDGQEWREYKFRWKPGDVNERPGFVAPFQPRLDWQMWFAALGTYRDNPWFMRFLGRLLEGSPEVTALLRTNPFPDKPPRMIRAPGYDYHFTRIGEAGSAWWAAVADSGRPRGRRSGAGRIRPDIAAGDEQRKAAAPICR